MIYSRDPVSGELRARTATPEELAHFNQLLGYLWLDTPSGERWLAQQVAEVEAGLARWAEQ